jgi:hypothetical protein
LVSVGWNEYDAFVELLKEREEHRIDVMKMKTAMESAAKEGKE